MSWINALVLGLLQGVTEFLPVSSTAHMDIASRVLFQHDVGSAFSAIVQLGPIIAIIWYFRDDLKRYVAGIARSKSPAGVQKGDTDARLGWYTLLATIPLIIFGLLLEKKIDTTFRTFQFVGVALIVLAFIMLWSERAGAKNRSLVQMNFKQSQVVGWAQVLALVPGASRSGCTITAGLFEGLDHESATRFSFLLSIPAITLAGLYKLSKVCLFLAKPAALAHSQAAMLAQARIMDPFPGGLTASQLGLFLFASAVGGIFAFVVTNWFLGYMKEHNTGIFIVYRIVLGAAILLLLHAKVLQNNPRPEQASPVAVRSEAGAGGQESGVRVARLTGRRLLWDR